jgi:hypothetical protein
MTGVNPPFYCYLPLEHPQVQPTPEQLLPQVQFILPQLQRLTVVFILFFLGS